MKKTKMLVNIAKLEPSWCVCLEGVHQECGKHISSEQIHASLMCS